MLLSIAHVRNVTCTEGLRNMRSHYCMAVAVADLTWILALRLLHVTSHFEWSAAQSSDVRERNPRATESASLSPSEAAAPPLLGDSSLVGRRWKGVTPEMLVPYLVLQRYFMRLRLTRRRSMKIP